MKHLLERNRYKFERHLRRDGSCLIWTSSLNEAGYGKFQFREQGIKYKVSAHRAAFILAGGTLTNDQLLLHSCDRPACVEPSHLRIGTHQDNVRDRVLRSRSATGVRHGRAVLTPELVNKVRKMKSEGANLSAFARANGLNESTVRKAASKVSWC